MNNIAKIIYDSYKGEIPTQYSNVSKTEREEAIRKEMLGALGLEVFEKKAFRRAFRENKNKVYAIIEEVANQIMVNGDYAKNAFYNQFVEVQNLALGDKGLFYVEGQNQLVVSEFSGSHFDLRRTRVDAGSSFQLEMKDYGIKVFEYYERVASGRSDISKLALLIVEAIDKKISDVSQSTFVTALTNLPAVYKFSGSYNEDGILTTLAHVEAANGEKPVLVGTATALRKLQGTVDVKYSDSMKDAKNGQGFIPVWNGYVCLEIAQGHQLGGTTFTMPTDKVFAVCGNDKLVKIVLEGDTETKEISDGTDNADRSLEVAVTFKMGCAVAYNRMIGQISLT